MNDISIDVKNPLNGKLLYSIGEISDVKAKSVFDVAHQIEEKIKAMTLSERIAEVEKINQYVIKHQDFILDCIIAETGKSRTDGFAAEVFEVCDVIDVYKKKAKKLTIQSNFTAFLVLIFSVMI